MNGTPNKHHLSPAIDRALHRLMEERSLRPPDMNAYKALRSLPEQDAMTVIDDIASKKISNLSASIILGVKKIDPVRRIECNNFPVPLSLKSEPIEGDGSLVDLRFSNMGMPVAVNDSLKFRTSIPMVSEHLIALGKLEFRKAFLLLSYIGERKLEDVISVEKIHQLRDLDMSTFESQAWRAVQVGGGGITDGDRRLKQNFDWESSKTHQYHCLVDHNGKISFKVHLFLVNFCWTPSFHLWMCSLPLFYSHTQSSRFRNYFLFFFRLNSLISYDDSFLEAKGPFLHNTSNLLQRILGDDNIMLVRFAETETNGGSRVDLVHSMKIFHKLAADGISVGLRRYRFFVFKDGGKEEKKKNKYSSPVKCYFVRTESLASIDQSKPYILSNKSIQEARKMFMHVHTISSLSKYMARFSLILSKTLQLDIDLGTVNVEIVDDIPCLNEHGCIVVDESGETLIHTDGTGFISEDLALRCPRDVVKGLNKKEKCPSRKRLHIDENAPLLIQFRLFFMGYAIKGTVLVNRTLPPRTIQVRRSMVKVNQDRRLIDIDSFQINSFEIVSTSVRPNKAHLSRYLITLLSYGGVPRDFFIGLVRDALHEAKFTVSDPFIALKVALNSPATNTDLIRMLLVGIPLDEPYLHHRLSCLVKEERKHMREGKVPIPDCFYLMGTVDPTGKLGPNKICIVMDHGQITGDVLVYKHPGMHFGDIHVFSATYIKELNDFIGDSKFAIFFPAQGPRSSADEIANSDFDGDMYWISQNSKLLSHFRARKPWERPPVVKSELIQPGLLSEEKLEQTLFDAFLVNRFHPSNTVSVAADSWLAYMDRLLTLGDDCEDEKKCLRCKMLQLTNIFYAALDAPKTGIKVEVPKNLKADQYPHYMERDNSYISTSILGQIYDEVMSLKEDTQPAQGTSLLPCFTDEVPESMIRLWTEHFRQYRAEMTAVLDGNDDSKNAAAEAIISKYKEILYEAPEYEASTKPKEDILVEALAIYQVVYAYVKNLETSLVCNVDEYHSVGAGSNQVPGSRCQFAWRVAGAALCELYARLHNRESVLCSPVILKEMMGRLLEFPLRKRRQYLKDLFHNARIGYFEFVKEITVEADEAFIESQETLARINSFLEDAFQDSCEGIIVKSLDTDAEYAASKRRDTWLKVKKDYIDGLSDSFDLVPIGAWHGNGRKAGWFSPFLMACYNVDSEEFQSVCRVMSGFSDSFYVQMKRSYAKKPLIIELLRRVVFTGARLGDESCSL